MGWSHDGARGEIGPVSGAMAEILPTIVCTHCRWRRRMYDQLNINVGALKAVAIVASSAVGGTQPNWQDIPFWHETDKRRGTWATPVRDWTAGRFGVRLSN